MKYILLVLILSITPFVNSYSQNVVSKSEKTETINGKKYIIHTVKKGETVYGICKTYGISDKELVQENPEVFDGIKPGQELKIIIKPKKKVKSPDYIYFTVKKGQTIYSITKQYKISEEELYKYNPELKTEGLKTGQEIRIKKKTPDLIKKPKEVNANERYIKHKVKRKETLYSISKKYDLSIDDIIKANPEIKDNGLQKGMILNIPTKDFLKHALWQAQQDSISKAQQLQDSLLKQNQADSACTKITFNKSTRIKIGLMLPFALDSKTLNIELKTVSDQKQRPKTKPFFEMYQGILLALNEFKKEGYNIDLYVFDTKKNTNTVKEILKKPEIQELNFIIGPVYKNTFDTALKYKPANIPLINPIKDVEDNYNKNKTYIQLNPTKDIIYDYMTRYIANKNNVRYIVIYDDNDQKSKDNTWVYSERLKHYKTDSTDIVKIKFDNKIKNFKKYFAHDKPNIILIPSEKEAFVTDVLTKLNISVKDDSVCLYGFKSWLKYKIQTTYYHKLSLTIFSNKVADYHSNNVDNFLNKYREEYNCEASDYSLVGYDVLKSFVNFVSTYNNINNCITNFKYHGLIYDISFIKQDKHFVNNKLFTIKLTKDYKFIIKK